MTSELLRRHERNPILTSDDLPFLCNAIYNPGATKFGDEYILLARVEDGRRDNKLHVCRSRDGVDFTVEPTPIAITNPIDDGMPEKHLYDPRITLLENSYYITYCSQGFDETVRIGLLKTDDFATFERVAYIAEPWNRNCAIFPEKIGGRYARFDRPMSGDDVINVVSYSPDLVHWGESKAIELEPVTWFRQKWGVGPTPIKTDAGWLTIFHGVWLAVNYVYRLGVVLLDLEDPSKVVGQCPEFILTPREDYERTGETINCVFSNGAIVEPNGEVKVYYGAADSCIGLATTTIDELVEACLRNGRAR